VTCGTDVNCATNQMQPSGPFTFDADGNFVSGGFTGFGATANNTQYSRNRSITTDYSGGFKWALGDNLKLNGDIQYIDSTAENVSYTAFPQMDGGPSTSTFAGDLPKISFGPTATNPANYYIIALMDHLEDSNADELAGRLDLEWSFDDGSPLQSFTAGVRYTDRSAVNRSTPYKLAVPVGALGRQHQRAQRPAPTALCDQQPFDSTFFHGQATGTVGGVPFFNWHQIVDGPAAFMGLSQAAGPSCCGPYPRTIVSFTGNDINTQDEQTYAGYAMLRFDFGRSGDFPLDGNIGLRVVKTKAEAIGQYIVTYRTAADPVNDGAPDHAADRRAGLYRGPAQPEPALSPHR
jgi:hypothetical protein